ncbi:hypothetical protein LOSG293_230080 [Secundilactobacillus oryzae JCM 18671]|uniref:Uncharacterized protein n=2 Tax=Secundilactobacillus oryzae TaxID=1202668 RepID=A0A081BJP2_9LACO|nr:hypothetical protein [Secundilactobacillus oryzae]GAK48260.1 hypothetical protein LOSG293_230080 [Secundilactobacillus oryzae JCM 18671]
MSDTFWKWFKIIGYGFLFLKLVALIVANWSAILSGIIIIVSGLFYLLMVGLGGLGSSGSAGNEPYRDIYPDEGVYMDELNRDFKD